MMGGGKGKWLTAQLMREATKSRVDGTLRSISIGRNFITSKGHNQTSMSCGV